MVSDEERFASKRRASPREDVSCRTPTCRLHPSRERCIAQTVHHFCMYPTPVSMHDIPLFSRTAPEPVHHSLNALNGALCWWGSSSSFREGYRSTIMNSSAAWSEAHSSSARGPRADTKGERERGRQRKETYRRSRRESSRERRENVSRGGDDTAGTETHSSA